MVYDRPSVINCGVGFRRYSLDGFGGTIVQIISLTRDIKRANDSSSTAIENCEAVAESAATDVFGDVG